MIKSSLEYDMVYLKRRCLGVVPLELQYGNGGNGPNTSDAKITIRSRTNPSAYANRSWQFEQVAIATRYDIPRPCLGSVVHAVLQ